jgi:hypothetical protein
MYRFPPWENPVPNALEAMKIKVTKWKPANAFRVVAKVTVELIRAPIFS